MNPAGSLPDPAQDQRGSRLYFSRFRPFFTNAGFEVIDCPRLTYTKNAADIRLVLDVVDALATNAQYDEFVIASGDSDMTPLLVRLRSADRRTTIVSPSDAADAFTSIADRLINGQQVLELMQGDQDLETGTSELGHEDQVPKQEFEVPASPVIIDTEGYAGFTHFIQARYDAASEPINLSVLATEARHAMGAQIDASQWFGLGGFGRSVRNLGLEDLRMSQHFMWHAGRHNAPPGAVEEDPSPRAEPVEQVRALLNLPRLPRDSWADIYRVLAEYASTHEFNLTEGTRWSRDRLVAMGVEVNRRAIGLVANGSTYGGVPLYREPSPTSAEIRQGFIGNVVKRAEVAGILMSSADVAVVTSWLGGDPGGTDVR